jgi:hypothetical protein
MTGHADLAGGVDFAGRGIVTVTRFSQPDSDESSLRYTYAFGVPEPSTAVLLAAELVGLRLVRGRTRRGVRRGPALPRVAKSMLLP